MTLQEAFATAKVVVAHVVDDAYNEAPNVPCERGALQTFVDALNEEQSTQLIGLLGATGGNDDAIEKLADLEALAMLFKARSAFEPASQGLFQDYLTEQAAKRAQVQKLLDLLSNCGVACRTFGADYAVDGDAPQLVFVDLRLREKGPLQISDALDVLAKLRRTHAGIRPFVILMSTQANTLSAHREEFRRKSEVFASQFEALPKDLFADEDELAAILLRYARVLPQLLQLHTHIDGLVRTFEEAAKEVKRTVLALDLADYFVLHQNTASIEKVSLGAYFADLLLEYMAAEIEESDAIWRLAKDLDAWDLRDLPRSRFALTPAAAKIYSKNVLHASGRLTQETARQLDSAHGYFYLGDIFLPKEDFGREKFTRALVVITPVCDLARPNDLKDETLLLCEGNVKAVTPATVAAAEDGVAQVVLPDPTGKAGNLLIKWEKKRLHTWHRTEIENFADPAKCVWTRVARLRPLYALQLQHAITGDLSRIGLQRPPNVIEPQGVEVLIRGAGSWTELLKVNDPSAGALSDGVDQKKKKTVFILADSVVRDIRHRLATWIGANAGAPSVPSLQKALALQDFEQRLMYLAQDVPTVVAGKEPDFGGYPLATSAGLDAIEKGAIALVRPDKPCRYAPVRGGGPAREDDEAWLVIKFMKIRAAQQP